MQTRNGKNTMSRLASVALACGLVITGSVQIAHRPATAPPQNSAVVHCTTASVRPVRWIAADSDFGWLRKWYRIMRGGRW